MVQIPLCFQCHTSNRCHCKVVGPTVGFVAFVVTAVVEWPVGAVVYLFRHSKGRRIMAQPAHVVYPKNLVAATVQNLLAAIAVVPLDAATVLSTLGMHGDHFVRLFAMVET
ncbi:hypothetical protein Vadar_009070 [Vaccinium darrowii]|uniref:Uncharacterized protein n=1 Tax=Vaccinium darrowii TaxID=229202 RepID=A0ACB7YCZ7_9ERIC|nr:hypothetical protein Vadar_009070 [Vaccinium darrowii]